MLLETKPQPQGWPNGIIAINANEWAILFRANLVILLLQATTVHAIITHSWIATAIDYKRPI
jgi:hypothetical protein